MSTGEDNRSFRLVCADNLINPVKNLLEAEGFLFEDEPFSPICQKFTKTPFPPGSSLAAFFGYIYIQDRSSMLPPLALAPSPKDFVLDMCASPGSKTGFLAQLVGSDGFVLANEPNGSRFDTLRENLARLNLFNYGLSRYNAVKLPFHNNSLKYILLDPPCSGWGTVAKNHSVLRLWKDDKVLPLIKIQRSLLEKAIAILQPGGRLLYSTCTTNREENEKQIEQVLLKGHTRLIPLEPFAGFHFEEELLKRGMLLVDAEASQSQGFFLALLEKTRSSGEENIFSVSQCNRHKTNRPICLSLPLPGKGQARVYGESVRYISTFVHEALPDCLKWEAPLLGKLSHNNDFKPQARLRYPEILSNLKAMKINNVAEIRSLLEGRSATVNTGDGMAALWWKDLPLGLIHIKKGRIINTFR